MALTAKQARFVAEYLADLNATQAAIRAGYSVKVAAVQGHENLRKPYIAAAIEEGKAQQLADAGVNANRVIEEYRRVAFSDPAAFFDEHDRLIAIRKLPREARAAIASVKSTKKNLTAGDGMQEDVVEVKQWDKLKALDALSRHLGIAQPKLGVTHTLSLESLVSGSQDEEK